MSDRITGLVFLALSIWYGLAAGSFAGGFGDPLGPAAFPEMLAVPAGLFSLYLIVRPDPSPDWAKGGPAWRQLATVAVLVGYAFLLEPLGFLLATGIGVTLVGRILGAGWLKAIVSGALMSVVLFGLFDSVLGLPLPLAPSFLD